MSGWQNTDYFERGYLPICQDDCAISNPEGMDKTRALVLGEDTEKRSSAFSWARTVIAKGGTYAVEAFAHGAISDDQEILDKASGCVDRIRQGKCERYVLAGDEVPEHFRGVLSRQMYEKLREE